MYDILMSLTLIYTHSHKNWSTSPIQQKYATINNKILKLDGYFYNLNEIIKRRIIQKTVWLFKKNVILLILSFLVCYHIWVTLINDLQHRFWNGFALSMSAYRSVMDISPEFRVYTKKFCDWISSSVLCRYKRKAHSWFLWPNKNFIC